jgi:two-component system, cell cycle sensor histidine kinase PleC
MIPARLPSFEEFDAAAMPSVLEALHCLRVAITLFDEDERLVFANEHFNHLFRSLPPREELVGLSYEDLIRREISGGEISGAEALRDIEGFVAVRRSQFKAGEYAPRDVTLADGRIVEIKARRTPDGGWIALWTDVTQARNNLSRLESAIALGADAFAFYDRSDRLVLCNEEYAAFNGAASPQELTGCAFPEVAERLSNNGLAGADLNDWLKRRLEAHRAPAGAMTVELRSGKAYLLRDRATGDGGRVVVLTDVTEHCRVEKALSEQTNALEATLADLARSKAETVRQATYLADLSTKLDRTAAEAHSTKTTLLRTMSHELKTPLNAIIGFSDLLGSLAERASPEQVKEYAGLIHQGGNNLLRLINQILDLTKIAAGRYELRRQRIDAGLGLQFTKDKFEEKAAARRIVIDAEGCPPGIFVEADENAFTLMIHQLADNAVRFTQEGGAIAFSAARDGDFVRLTVADNGPGVPAGDLGRILEPFEQLARGTADHSGGAGLGLTLVKAFSELHGGSLTLDSAPGEGFRAVIELPAAG